MNPRLGSQLPGPRVRVAGEADLPGLQLTNIVVNHRRRAILDHARLGVLPGSVTALWGQAGSGKTTLLQVAAGITRPDGGSVHISGIAIADEPARARALTGWVPANRQDLGPVTPRELLGAFAAGHHLPERVGRRRLAEVLDRLGLAARADRRAHQLTLAEHTRLLIGCAIMHSPAVLLLDEPFTGLDSQDREEIGDLLRGLANTGTAVLATAADPFLLDTVGDRTVEMSAGRITASRDHGRTDAGRLWQIVSLDAQRLHDALDEYEVDYAEAPAAAGDWSNRAAVTVAVAHEQEATALLAALARAGVPVYGFGPGGAPAATERPDLPAPQEGR